MLRLKIHLLEKKLQLSTKTFLDYDVKKAAVHVGTDGKHNDHRGHSFTSYFLLSDKDANNYYHRLEKNENANFDTGLISTH
jgi:predicted cupin superfamily sugar epimerase